MAEPHPSSGSGRRSLVTAGLVLALSVAVLLLYGLTFAVRRLPCAFLLLAVALAAWPIWWYRMDRVLLERRAILATVATPSSAIMRWFWGGPLTAVLQAFAALLLATLLLSFTTSLLPAHWAVLAADAILLALLFGPVKRRLAHQIRAEHRGFVARRWPLTAINVAVVVALLVGLEFFVLGRPDTRGLPWYEVATQAFDHAQIGTACAAAGALMGLGSAIDQTTWHAAMWLIPALPDAVLKVLAWCLFLAWTSFGAFLFTRLLLGIMTLVESWTSAEARTSDAKPFSRTFLYTLLAIAVPYFILTTRLADMELPPLDSLRETRVGAIDPCQSFTFDAAALQTTINRDVDRARTEAHALADQRIDSALDTAFGKAEQGVDRYLDWYFSLLGDYTRLAAVVGGDVARLMSAKLSQHLFDDTHFKRGIEVASANLESETLQRMTGVAESVGARIGGAASNSPCPIKRIDLDRLVDLERDKLRMAVSTTFGVGVGTLTARYLMRRPVAAVAGRLAARGTVKTAGQFLAKGAAKRGASSLTATGSGIAICAPTGPAALLCGAVAGIVTWFAVDKAMIEIDEALFRDKMRDELLSGLTEQRARMEDELKAMHRALADAYAVEIESTTAKVFNPSRDGF